LDETNATKLSDTILTIGFQFATGAVPGDYEITVNVTRV
jgi:hypothetical protein